MTDQEYFMELHNQMLEHNGSRIGHRLTVGQLKDACKKHRFLLLRHLSGFQMAVNSLVAPISLKKKEYKNNQDTSFISYRSCSFQEYITKKCGFVKP